MPNKPFLTKNDDRKKLFYLTIVVIILSYFTYFFDYTYPNTFYWDEIYHVAYAQKYLEGVFFIEIHPPLGKLLIAAGELLFNANTDDTQFINQEYATQYPPGFSMAGYRFFPVLLAWLSAPLIFLFLYQLTKNLIVAFFCSFLLIFDNALIVHFRAAMLDGMLVFFILLSFYITSLILEKEIEHKQRNNKLFTMSLLLGFSIAAASSVKLTGLITTLLAVLILVQFRKKPPLAFYTSIMILIGFCTITLGSQAIHLLLSNKINPELPDNGKFYLKSEFVEAITTPGFSKIKQIPQFIIESTRYSFDVNNSVPKTNLEDPFENGSKPLSWLSGSKSINYLVKENNDNTKTFLYLQSNPAVWFFSFLFIIIAITIVFKRLLLFKLTINTSENWLTFMVLFYIAFLISMSIIERKLYLYHYFPALICTFSVIALILSDNYLFKTKTSQVTGSSFIGLVSIIAFFQYKPLTYFEPINKVNFEQLNILQIWGLRF